LQTQKDLRKTLRRLQNGVLARRVYFLIIMRGLSPLLILAAAASSASARNYGGSNRLAGLHQGVAYQGSLGSHVQLVDFNPFVTDIQCSGDSMEIHFNTLVANHPNMTAIPYSQWMSHPLKWVPGDVVSGSAGWGCGHAQSGTAESADAPQSEEGLQAQTHVPFLREIWSVVGSSAAAAPGSFVLRLRTSAVDVHAAFDALTLASSPDHPLAAHLETAATPTDAMNGVETRVDAQVSSAGAPSGSHGHATHAAWSERVLDPHDTDAAAFRCSRRLFMATERPVFGDKHSAPAADRADGHCTPALVESARRRVEVIKIEPLSPTNFDNNLQARCDLRNVKIAVPGQANAYVYVQACDLIAESYQAFFLKLSRPGTTGALSDDVISSTPKMKVYRSIWLRIGFPAAYTGVVTAPLFRPVSRQVTIRTGPINSVLSFNFAPTVKFDFSVPAPAAFTFQASSTWGTIMKIGIFKQTPVGIFEHDSAESMAIVNEIALSKVAWEVSRGKVAFKMLFDLTSKSTYLGAYKHDLAGSFNFALSASTGNVRASCYNKNAYIAPEVKSAFPTVTATLMHVETQASTSAVVSSVAAATGSGAFTVRAPSSISGRWTSPPTTIIGMPACMRNFDIGFLTSARPLWTVRRLANASAADASSVYMPDAEYFAARSAAGLERISQPPTRADVPTFVQVAQSLAAAGGENYLAEPGLFPNPPAPLRVLRQTTDAVSVVLCKEPNVCVYRMGNWTNCDAMCGTGLRRRSVSCVHVSTGRRLPLAYCTASATASAVAIAADSPDQSLLAGRPYIPSEVASCAAGPCGGMQMYPMNGPVVPSFPLGKCIYVPVAQKYMRFHCSGPANSASSSGMLFVCSERTCNTECFTETLMPGQRVNLTTANGVEVVMPDECSLMATQTSNEDPGSGMRYHAPAHYAYVSPNGAAHRFHLFTEPLLTRLDIAVPPGSTQAEGFVRQSLMGFSSFLDVDHPLDIAINVAFVREKSSAGGTTGTGSTVGTTFFPGNIFTSLELKVDWYHSSLAALNIDMGNRAQIDSYFVIDRANPMTEQPTGSNCNMFDAALGTLSVVNETLSVFEDLLITCASYRVRARVLPGAQVPLPTSLFTDIAFKGTGPGDSAVAIVEVRARNAHELAVGAAPVQVRLPVKNFVKTVYGRFTVDAPTCSGTFSPALRKPAGPSGIASMFVKDNADGDLILSTKVRKAANPTAPYAWPSAPDAEVDDTPQAADGNLSGSSVCGHIADAPLVREGSTEVVPGSCKKGIDLFHTADMIQLPPTESSVRAEAEALAGTYFLTAGIIAGSQHLSSPSDSKAAVLIAPIYAVSTGETVEVSLDAFGTAFFLARVPAGASVLQSRTMLFDAGGQMLALPVITSLAAGRMGLDVHVRTSLTTPEERLDWNADARLLPEFVTVRITSMHAQMCSVRLNLQAIVDIPVGARSSVITLRAADRVVFRALTPAGAPANGRFFAKVQTMTGARSLVSLLPSITSSSGAALVPATRTRVVRLNETTPTGTLFRFRVEPPPAVMRALGEEHTLAAAEVVSEADVSSARAYLSSVETGRQWLSSGLAAAASGRLLAESYNPLANARFYAPAKYSWMALKEAACSASVSVSSILSPQAACGTATVADLAPRAIEAVSTATFIVDVPSMSTSHFHVVVPAGMKAAISGSFSTDIPGPKGAVDDSSRFSARALSLVASNCNNTGSAQYTITVRLAIGTATSSAAITLIGDPVVPAACGRKFMWQAPAFPECPADCKNVVQRRAVSCADVETGVVVDPAFCVASNAGEAPAEEKTCALSPCAVVPGEWSDCSAPCGDGFQYRPVSCVNANGTGSAVSLFLCGSSTQGYLTSRACPLAEIQSRPECNAAVYTAKWKAGAWSSCSARSDAPCSVDGPNADMTRVAVRRRAVQCIGADAKVKPDIACDVSASGQRPDDWESCSTTTADVADLSGSSADVSIEVVYITPLAFNPVAETPVIVGRKPSLFSLPAIPFTDARGVCIRVRRAGMIPANSSLLCTAEQNSKATRGCMADMQTCLAGVAEQFETEASAVTFLGLPIVVGSNFSTVATRTCLATAVSCIFSGVCNATIADAGWLFIHRVCTRFLPLATCTGLRTSGLAYVPPAIEDVASRTFPAILVNPVQSLSEGPLGWFVESRSSDNEVRFADNDVSRLPTDDASARWIASAPSIRGTTFLSLLPDGSNGLPRMNAASAFVLAFQARSTGADGASPAAMRAQVRTSTFPAASLVQLNGTMVTKMAQNGFILDSEIRAGGLTLSVTLACDGVAAPRSVRDSNGTVNALLGLTAVGDNEIPSDRAALSWNQYVVRALLSIPALVTLPAPGSDDFLTTYTITLPRMPQYSPSQDEKLVFSIPREFTVSGTEVNAPNFHIRVRSSDRDCKVSGWTDWSTCKAQNPDSTTPRCATSAHPFTQSRTRIVVEAASGTGATCPSVLETRFCNPCQSCAAKRCLNGGQCVLGNCVCLSGFRGESCEIPAMPASLFAAPIGNATAAVNLVVADWTVGEWTSCASSAGASAPLTSSRPVRCVDFAAQKQIEDSACSATSKPNATRACPFSAAPVRSVVSFVLQYKMPSVPSQLMAGTRRLAASTAAPVSAVVSDSISQALQDEAATMIKLLGADVVPMVTSINMTSEDTADVGFEAVAGSTAPASAATQSETTSRTLGVVAALLSPVSIDGSPASDSVWTDSMFSQSSAGASSPILVYDTTGQVTTTQVADIANANGASSKPSSSSAGLSGTAKMGIGIGVGAAAVVALAGLLVHTLRKKSGSTVRDKVFRSDSFGSVVDQTRVVHTPLPHT
jgi:hypothetical protein